MGGSFFSHLSAALGITAPILVVLALGALFRQKKWVDGHFVEVGNRLLFYVCMPSLLFLACLLYTSDAADDRPRV